MTLGFSENQSAIKSVLAAANEAQKLIDELHLRDPGNQTFEQVGFLNGQEIIKKYIDRNEWGLGLEHLLYMIHESDIEFPEAVLLDLHQMADQLGIRIYKA